MPLAERVREPLNTRPAWFSERRLLILCSPDHPADGVDDIAFSAAIGANYACHPFIEVQHGLVRKTFKTFDL